MTERLKSVLLRIDFKSRYVALFDKHSHRNFFRKADPEKVQAIIEKLGYVCRYHKNGKFFEIDNVQPNLSLNLSTDIGIVDFIFSTTVDGEGDGGPFRYMCTFVSTDDNFKPPRFANYEELEEILIEGFRMYEDIKKGLLESQA
ncbi:hypothetical protein [Chryseolinea lacunae]|uniref:Uncharacterized protein n=1 Tax=Chryseolinea lacunae TaxID=2801331 RepID=A0ABS1KWU1_9BACT|nr:hypothetical protein [Chryseolinea lacunae]MBL0743874.1 hypothetical protein [Chryseolinea lacunae]